MFLRLMQGGQEQLAGFPDNKVAGFKLLQNGDRPVDLAYKARVFFLVIHGISSNIYRPV